MESSTGKSNNSNPPLLRPLTPSMYRGPSFSSSFNISVLSTYCPLSLNMCTDFPSLIFFLDSKTSSQDCFIYFLHFLPNFSSLWSVPTSSISFPLTHSFFTCSLASVNILLLKMSSQGHQWPSHHLIFLGFFS